jgi:hypothetical protein
MAKEGGFVNSEYLDPKDADYVANYKPDHLYTHEFGNKAGKYLSVVTEHEDGSPKEVDYEYAPDRYKLRLTYIKERNDINEVLITKYRYSRKKEWKMLETEGVRLDWFSFQKLFGLLQFLSSLDLPNIDARRITLAEDGLGDIDADTKRKIKTLLARQDGAELVKELIKSGVITSADIVNLGYRKEQLRIFGLLLSEEGYVVKYGKENNIATDKPEKVWQYYFKKNEWIFGYGLDYRYLSILQEEPHVSDVTVDGSEGVVGDFLAGCTDFTVLVEVKTPDTPLFDKSQNRARSWRLSRELVYAVSQILEQKASWQIKSQTEQFDSTGKPLLQQTVDPKAVLIMGRSEQYRGDDLESRTKARTFELFCRDSRKVEILTYDQLYERAKFIVEHEQKNT